MTYPGAVNFEEDAVNPQILLGTLIKLMAVTGKYNPHCKLFNWLSNVVPHGLRGSDQLSPNIKLYDRLLSQTQRIENSHKESNPS